MKPKFLAAAAVVMVTALGVGSWWAASPAEGPKGSTTTVKFTSPLPFPPASAQRTVLRLTVLTTPSRAESWFSSVTPVMSLFATVPAQDNPGEGVAASAVAADSAASRLLLPSRPPHRVVVSTDRPVPSGLRPGDTVVSLKLPVARHWGVPASPATTTVLRAGRSVTVVSVHAPEQSLSYGVGRPAPLVPAHSTGPSAGLAFALAYVDGFSAGELFPTLVAATGAIGFDGSVNPVAGLELKAAAAAAGGATVMFVPWGTDPKVVARLRGIGAPAGMEVLPVPSLTAAVRELCDRGATDAVCSALPPKVDPAQVAFATAKLLGRTVAGVTRGR